MKRSVYRDAVVIEVLAAEHQTFRLVVLVGAQKKAVVLVLDCLDRHVEWEALGVLQAAERALNQVFNFLTKKRDHLQFGIGVLHKVRVSVISSAVKHLLLLGSGLDNKNHKRSSEKKGHLERMPHRRDWLLAKAKESTRCWAKYWGVFRCAFCDGYI